MNTRRTNDYSPLIEGSSAYNTAVQERKAMLASLASRDVKQKPTRKTWAQRMEHTTGKSFH